MANEMEIQKRFTSLSPWLDERLRRLFAAAEAKAIGRGGATTVARVMGISRRAIWAGGKELQAIETAGRIAGISAGGRIRKTGGGRKRTVTQDPTLTADLEALVSPAARGDPESPLGWTCKSVRKLTQELRARGHQTGHRMVAELLKDMGYSLQANRKTREGADHPDRDAQFQYLNACVRQALAVGEPVISVDTKKKELVGDFKNAGREWQPQGQPERVRVHDFKLKELGRVAPYGIYDMAKNVGWVRVGIDHDTAEFAVATIRNWWKSMGQALYPQTHQLLITADGGGSNGSRLRLWKVELPRFVNEINCPSPCAIFRPVPANGTRLRPVLVHYAKLAR